MLLGDGRGARIPRGCDQTVDLRIALQCDQQRMFTGTGTDHHDAHAANPNGRASPHLPTSTNEDEHTLDHDLYGQQRARA
jgi:hypothetical protein